MPNEPDAPASPTGVETDPDADGDTPDVPQPGPAAEPDETDAAAEGTTGDDPLVPNSTLVNVDIIVPVFQSDSLRVELSWGDIELVARWVGDEFWSAAGEFPTETAHPLTVTFYDFNGDIELAQAVVPFRTGSNASQSVQIRAEQFDSDRFDEDGDGTSNLDERAAGTNPFVDQDALLEIYDDYALSTYSRMSVSDSFESRLTDERPLFDTFEGDPDSAGSISGEVNIDADGNGTLTFQQFFNRSSRNYELTGTRTYAQNAVSWEGLRSAYDGDYRHIVNVNNTVTVVDESTSEFAEEIVGSNRGTYHYQWETSTRLIGARVEASSRCKPVAGTINTTYRTEPGGEVEVTTVSKQIGDRYWRVVYTENDGDAQSYFVRELQILDGAPGSAGTYFICDFVDIQ